MKKVLTALMLASGLALVVAGCGKDEKAGGHDGKTGAASGESVGVAECDDYIKKYEACMSKVPAAGRPAMEQAFKTQRESFKSGASTPEGKAALKGTCKQLVDSLAQNPACK